MHFAVLNRRYWVVPVAVWSVVVLASFAWNWREMDRHAFALAEDRAMFVFKMVEAVRLWNARHGGVYAPIDERTPPNPYLEVPDRDVVTLSGRELTMINPAYMTRQLTEVVRELSDLRLHLTSLDPINPGNAPDAWERMALQRFEAGAAMVTELVGSGGEAVYRFMAPLRTEQACLKCHEQQGYRLGDIRGGVGVAFSAAPLLGPEAAQRRNMILWHVAVWVLLSGLSLVALARLRRQYTALEEANACTEGVVAERTAQLRAEVAERKQAEARLRIEVAERHQAEAQLRLFIESSGEAIYAVDGDGACTLINAEALRLLGCGDADAVVGRDMRGLVHHSLADGTPRPAESCRIARTYRHGEAVHADDDVFWRADRSAFAVEFRSRPLSADGALIGAVVTFSDITERKRNEARLKKLSSAVEHSPAVAIITDFDGRIEYVNPRFSEVTGYAAEEVLGKNPRLWQSGKTPPKTYQRLWATIKEGYVWHGEVMNRTKDGRFYWEDAHISPIRDEQGHITHFVAVKEDITERKELEAQVWHQAHHDDLTDLPNRELFRIRLEAALVQSDQHGHQAALLYIDLDEFKPVNDTLGHDAGDELLRQVARRIGDCLRDSDTAARLGGDEFAVILARVNGREGAAVVADKVLTALASGFQVAETEVAVSASIGIALYPGDGDTGEQLVKNSDVAMYRAKHAGRNQCRFFTEPG